MLGIANIPAFLAAATLIVIAPGPASFYVASRAQLSIGLAALAVLGIVAGDIVLISLSGLGFSAIVSQWPVALTAIKIAGGLYVAWLGLSMLRAPPPMDDASKAPVSRSALKGFLITLGNPKAILFFGAFFPMFIDPATGHWMVSFYALGALFQMVNLLYFAALILAVSQLRRSGLFRRWPAARTNVICGTGLLLCAVFVLASAFF